LNSENPSQNVAVIGQGYVGLPLALTLAQRGFKVIGIDVSTDVVNNLNRGVSHVEDVSEGSLNEALNSGRYYSSTDFSRIAGVSTCVICVPTPLGPDREPDISYIESALRFMAPHLNSDVLIINESTSFPGTLNELVIPTLRKLLGDFVDQLLFASAPERIDPGNKIWNFSSTPRVVSGITPEATARALDFYRTICSDVSAVSKPEVAELSKLLENTFRQVNIALINQMVPVAHALGIDMREVIEAAGTKPYGFMKFYPGAGVGGHCIPIDPLYLLWKAGRLGIDLPFIRSADSVNRSMPEYVSKRAIELSNLGKDDTILLLGVAYKSGVADTRETPAKELATSLSKFGVKVFWFDPLVKHFPFAEKWHGKLDVDCSIIVTAQEGLPVSELAQARIPVLDCTGYYRDIEGVTHL